MTSCFLEEKPFSPPLLLLGLESPLLISFKLSMIPLSLLTFESLVDPQVQNRVLLVFASAVAFDFPLCRERDPSFLTDISQALLLD